MKTVFLRALEADDKREAVRGAIDAPGSNWGKCRFEVDSANFASVPGSPFAYWVSDRLQKLFRTLPPFGSEGRTAKQGLATGDDFRFVRAWWAVSPAKISERWYPFAKGGTFSRFYADLQMLIGYSRGDQVGLMAIGRYGRGAEFYFHPGLSWPLRGIRFSAQAVPAGCIFSIAGKMAFVPDDVPGSWLALFNAQPFDSFIAFFAGKVGGVQYEAGLIQGVPVPQLTHADHITLAQLATRAWSAKRTLDTRTETSHAFALPALLQVEGVVLSERSGGWAKRVGSVDTELATIQAEIDARCFDLYGIGDADRRTITEGFGTASVDATDATAPDGDNDAESDDDPTDTSDLPTLTSDLLSWAAGVAFGRFDIRLATGERPLPPEPEPFDPLPTHSPGMLAAPYPAWRLGPLRSPPAHLLDDPGHPTHDLTAAVRAVFDVVFGDASHARWEEAAALLDPKHHDLRTWLSRSFFEHHLKRHSKSRRKAPILWQLATASSRYAVWLYAHRVTNDTFFQVQNDLVAPKLAHEERRQSELLHAGGPSPSASQRKELDEQAGVVEELRTMLDEVKRIAPLWRPDLDDGIVLTMAPLWRLVPQHKAWQKELKAAWDALAAGTYDWAHLAMHLWPERVVPKCQTDRSLAIAHGLEEVFWVEDAGGKWKARAEPTRSVEALVQERTSPAVRAALKSLVEAPVAGSGGGKRARKPRSP